MIRDVFFVGFVVDLTVIELILYGIMDKPKKPSLERIRVASLQYFIRPVPSFQEFANQVEGLVYTALDYKCDLLVFPEYFTLQLLTLGDLKKKISDQVRDLSQYEPRYRELMVRLAKETQMYIVGGSIPMTDKKENKLYNDCYFFGPTGQYGVQRKMHMTRFEKEDWDVSPGEQLHIFETALGKIAITICYDVEFPEIARAAAREGCFILVVPTCTDDRQGYLRVRYCAHARAIENQMFVIQSSCVGSLPMVPAVAMNYGQACILTPSDFSFARDGILAEGIPNQETMVIGELNLKMIRSTRAQGTVLPLRDSKRTAQVLAEVQHISL